MSWFLAPSLVKLRDEINAAYPNRDKASDGAVGDTSHSARQSSHNPLWSAPGNWSGVVRAIDVDSNGAPGQRTKVVNDMLAATIGDHRVWYVIWNRQIWSRTHGWEPRYYDGSNPHDKHVHVSLREDSSAWGDTSDWLEAAPVKPTYPKAPAGDVVSWNCKVGNRPHFKAELDTLAGKTVIGLMETGGHRNDITAWAKAHGYSIFGGVGETGASSLILVKHGSGVIDHGVVTVKTPWRGPKGKRINGRAFPWVKMTLDGRKTLIILAHMPWGPTKPANIRAWVACSRVLRRFATINPGWDVLIMGDLNQAASSRLPYSILGTANKIGGRIIATGAPLDYAIFRRSTSPRPPGRPVVARGRRGDRLGSDHAVVTYSIGVAR